MAKSQRRAGKNKKRGQGEGNWGRVPLLSLPSPTPLLFFLLTPLCPVPTIWTPGTGYMLWNLVLSLAKRNDQFKMTRNVGLGFFIALFLHWFAFTTNVGNLLHVNTGMIDPAWSENPLTHILRTLKKISSLCLYCYVLVIFNIKTVHTALNFNRKSETTLGSFIITLLRYFTCSSLSTATLFRRQLLL